jgi:hypothetical protein
VNSRLPFPQFLCNSGALQAKKREWGEWEISLLISTHPHAGTSRGRALREEKCVAFSNWCLGVLRVFYNCASFLSVPSVCLAGKRQAKAFDVVFGIFALLRGVSFAPSFS